MSGPAVHALLTQNRNALAVAVSVATNPRPVSQLPRPTRSGTGNGRAELEGPYTGAGDTRFEVQVLSGGGKPTASAPRLIGAGNGTAADIAVSSGAPPEIYTFTLKDPGPSEARAYFDVAGFRVYARADGAAGNGGEVEVDESGLGYEATDYSLLDAIEVGAADFTVEGHDWGQPDAAPGTVPADYHRVVIGDDRSRIYAAWKVYENGVRHYRISPAAVRRYEAGERIYRVSGGRTVTVKKGVAVENYTDIVTTRDLLVALQDSGVLYPETIPAPDLTDGNTPAFEECPLRTVARVDHTSGSGSQHARGFINHYAGANAATEIVTARCIAATLDEGGGLGNELWAWSASVSGEDLGTTRTGDTYRDPSGRFGAQIPTRLPPGYVAGSRGDISAEVNLVERDTDDVKPQICIDDLRLGSAAQGSGEVKFVWTKRPAGTCLCDGAVATRLPHADECLGLRLEEEIEMGESPWWLTSRIIKLLDWHNGYTDSQVTMGGDGEIAAAKKDIELGDIAYGVLGKLLTDLRDKGVVERTAWAADTAVSKGNIIVPVTGTGFQYEADKDGTTGAAEPGSWGTVIGGNTPDNGINWVCISKTPLEAWDDLLEQVDTELSALEGVAVDYANYEAVPVWAPGVSKTRGDVVRPVTGSVAAGFEPEDSGAVLVAVVGGVTAAGAGFQNHPGSDYQAYYRGALISDGGVLWRSLGNDQPFWSDSDINAEGDEQSGISFDPNVYASAYRVAADKVRATAGIVPDFSSASTTGTQTGSECWRDHPNHEYYWAPKGTSYKVAFNRKEYVSVKDGPDGEPVPTREFGFVPKTNPECDGLLEEGDSFTVRWVNAGGEQTYRRDDVLTMAVIKAAPLKTTGGVNPSTLHVWGARGSITGKRPDYVQDLIAPNLYDDGQLQVRLIPGAIAHRQNDVWTIELSALAWQWRQDGGGWDGPHDVGADGGLPDGLSVRWDHGAAPSLVAGDSAVWDLDQPFAVKHSAEPTDEPLGWDGDGCVITDIIISDVDAIGLPWHELPEGAVVHVSDGAGLDLTLPWREGPMVAVLEQTLTAPVTLTWTISNAPNGLVYWRYAGAAIRFEAREGQPANSQRIVGQRREYVWEVTEGAGVNPTYALNGEGVGFICNWPDVALYQEHLDALLAACRAHHKAGGAPGCFVPHEEVEEEAALVRLPKRVSPRERYDYQDGDKAGRVYALEMELEPWLT